MTDIDFLTRERSFSFLYFTGDVYDLVPTLLTSCGYSIIGRDRIAARFYEAIDASSGVEGPGNTIVHKAVYRVPGGTVLLDPEMVVGITHTDCIVQFCSEHGIEAYVVIWERFSQTVLGRQLTSNGVQVDVCLVGGNIQGEPINVPRCFMNQIGPASLKAFLTSAGAKTDEIFGIVSAQLFKLDESKTYHPVH